MSRPRAGSRSSPLLQAIEIERAPEILKLNAEFHAQQLRDLSEAIQNNSSTLVHIKSTAAEERHPSTPKSGCRTLKADDEHCAVISEALAASNCNRCLQVLDLQGGKIGDAGGASLSKGLKYSDIRKLDMSSNQLGGFLSF